MDIEINSAAPADLIAVLAKAGLAAHVGAFVDEGYEELGYLRELAANGGLEELRDDVGLNAPPPLSLKAQATRIQTELQLDATLTTVGAIIAAANEVMGIEPVVGPLPWQVERLNEAVGIDI